MVASFKTIFLIKLFFSPLENHKYKMWQGHAPFKKIQANIGALIAMIIFPDKVQLKKIKYEHPLYTRLNTKLAFNFTCQWLDGIHCKVRIPIMLETRSLQCVSPIYKDSGTWKPHISIQKEFCSCSSN